MQPGQQPQLHWGRPSGWRAWVFRAAALMLGLAPLLLCEAGLWIFDAGRPQDTIDPYLDFVSLQPLFVLSDDEQRYEVPHGRQIFFRPESFAAKKPVDEFRIFCLGGSTVQGRPFAIETSFTTWLELSLQAADPSRRWEVVNAGGVSYASYRLRPILEEVLQRKADLVILYTGHNEFLEERTYDRIPTFSSSGASSLLSHSRTYNVARQLVQRARGMDQQRLAGRPLLPTEVDALLDYRGGLEAYRRGDSWRSGVDEHFAVNVQFMVNRCRSAGVPVILVNPVVNLKDCPPFKFEPEPRLDAEQRARFSERWDRARQPDVRPDEQIAWLKEALSVDPEHAGVLYQLGKTYQALGETGEAAEALIKAKDADVCPLRILESMREDLREIARRSRVPLVDVQSLIASRSPDGMPGDEWLLDHVHPSIRGHKEIARVLLETMQQQSLVDPQGDWQEARKQAYAAHLDSLPPGYFARGKERLEGLRRWTQGRAFKVRSSSP